ncbi:MAG: undecaprenyl-diphosphate phosphatase [bacterium]|nr:undecaprenyl-diphosphate phosphatase [bacterium]
MDSWQALALGILQGITEFLPVSSSGHLVLAETWFGLEVQELLSFDVVVHAGTLCALVIYFRKDLWGMFLQGIGKPFSDLSISCHHLLLALIVATLPVVLIAPFAKGSLETVFRGEAIVVGFLGLTACLLATAELLGRYRKNTWLSLRTALVMGLFQILSLAPGVSRSGSTIVGGMIMGLSREKAARFSFLMAVPAILGAVVFLLKDILEQGSEGVGFEVLVVGFVSSAVVSAGAIHFMLKFLQRRSLWVFVAYLLALVSVWLLGS